MTMNILHWFASVVAVIIAAYLVPGVTVTLVGAIVVAIVLALINIFIKPIVLLLTLPINLITLGLFSLVINALMVMLADYFVQDFSIPGFWTALIFAVVLSLINWFFGTLVRK